jgi:hypothetical protein
MFLELGGKKTRYRFLANADLERRALVSFVLLLDCKDKNAQLAHVFLLKNH